MRGPQGETEVLSTGYSLDIHSLSTGETGEKMTKKKRLEAAYDHMVATYNAWRRCWDVSDRSVARAEMEIAHKRYCELLTLQ